VDQGKEPNRPAASPDGPGVIRRSRYSSATVCDCRDIGAERPPFRQKYKRIVKCLENWGAERMISGIMRDIIYTAIVYAELAAVVLFVGFLTVS
jgi:hypothetical protein